MSLLQQAGLHGLGWADLLSLWGHYLLLSMLAVGGAIATAPEMHRYLVGERGWLDDLQFNASIAIAQAAPGPNILFIALLGWNVAGAAGLLVAMSGILLPSSVLALAAGRLWRRRTDALWVRAFTAGMAPLTLGLLLATGWVLTGPTRGRAAGAPLVVATVLFSLRSRRSPLWMIAAGAAVGAAGLV